MICGGIDMKNKIAIFSFVWILLSPVGAYSEYTIPVIIQGAIGDYSKRARKYEIDGKVYRLPAGIALEDANGNRISSDKLKSGVVVKIIGEKVVGSHRNNTNRTIEFTRIILVRQ